MTKINYKSDFDFIAEVEAIGAEDNKVAIGFPQYDWEIILTTGDCCYNSRTYVVSYHKGVATIATTTMVRYTSFATTTKYLWGNCTWSFAHACRM